MKTRYAWGLALLCAGCQPSHQSSSLAPEPARQNLSLTPEQAMATAVQLANAKSDALYQKRPFEPGKLPQFIGGHWVWTGMGGVGQLDLEARIELAIDGSTNSVDLHLLDSRLSQRIIPQQAPFQRLP
jgi:hypothetical protein